jgi:hypothetical protein
MEVRPCLLVPNLELAPSPADVDIGPSAYDASPTSLEPEELDAIRKAFVPSIDGVGPAA